VCVAALLISTGDFQQFQGVRHFQVLRSQIQQDFNRNKYFNPQEALEYGLVDRVIKPPRTQALGVA
jgi:ATP-dependent protease ClpP protease subunit